MLIEAAQPCGPVFWQTHHPQVRHPMPSNLVLGAIYSITFFPMIVFRFSTPIVAGEVPQNVRGLKTLLSIIWLLLSNQKSRKISIHHW